MSVLPSGVNNNYSWVRNFGLGALAVGGALLADDVTGIGVADDPAAFIAIGIGAGALLATSLFAGCASETEGQHPDGNADGGINITPEVVDGEGIGTEETDGGPVLVVKKEFLIDDLGNKVQASGEIMLDPVTFTFSGAKDKTVKVIMESVPEQIFNKYGAPGLPCVSEQVKQELFTLDGLFDVTPVAYHPSEAQINIGTTDAPYYIRDPRVCRVPVFMGDINFNDLTGKLTDPAKLCEANNFLPEACSSITDEEGNELYKKLEVCSTDSLYQETCAVLLGAAGAPESASQPYPFIVPKETYNNNEGNFQVGHVLRTDTLNYTLGHDYALAVKIMLEIE